MIVILNYNNAIDTIDLSLSLLKQIGVRLKITIIDNCSTDNSYDILCNTLEKHESINILLSDSNGGYATGNNLGLRSFKNSTQKFVAILNNDLVIDDLYLFSKLISKYGDLEDAGFISPAQKKSNEEIYSHSAWKKPSFLRDLLMSFWLYRKYGKSNIYNLNQAKNTVEVDILPGSFLLTDYQFFKSIGFFDEGTFLFLEERILFEKVQQTKKQNYLIKDVFYQHESSSTIDQTFSNINKYKILFQSLSYYTKKYRKHGWLKLIILKPFLQYSIFELRLITFVKNILHTRKDLSKS
jgi:GT2 family glycosyltransferase